MPSRRSAMAAFAAAAVGAACGSSPSRRPPPPTLDQFAERYVRLTLRLALHQPSLVEAWRGPDAWRPDVREPVAGIRLGIVEAHAAIGDLRPEGRGEVRWTYLRDQLAALAIAARRLAGETIGFFAEASAALALDPKQMTASKTEVAQARDELERLLPGRGELRDRYTAFRTTNAIAPARVLPAFQAAVAACRAGVVPRIPLPASESVTIEEGRGAGLEARASYDGGFRTRVALDASGPVDLAHLVWLAAHETYPGHHVQHVLGDRDCIRGRGWQERLLSANFGRHYLHAEGAAEAGAELLLDGESFADICRSVSPSAGVRTETIADLVAVHRAVATLDQIVPGVAQAYLDGDIWGEAAAERLNTEALVPDGGRLLNAIERQRTRILAYPVGRRVVSAALAGGAADERWRRLVEVSTTLCLPRV